MAKKSAAMYASTFGPATSALIYRCMYEINPGGVLTDATPPPSTAAFPRGDGLAAPTPRQAFLREIARDYSELTTTVFRLALTERFVSSLNASTVSGEVLAYHLEKHLEELYILKERLTKLVGRLSGLAGKTDIPVEEKRRLKALLSGIKREFKSVLAVRGAHVHEQRFNDEPVSWIETLDPFVAGGGLDAEALEPLRQRHIETALTKWREEVSRNVAAAKKLLEHVSTEITSAVFELAPPP